MTGLGSEPAIKQSDKRAIQALLWALAPLLNLRWSILLPWVTIFLMVVLDEGKSVSAYARALGEKDRRIVSRYLRDIGERARNGGPGLGLVTVEQLPTHSRARARVLLTAKGRSVAQAILQQMRRPVDERRPAQCKNCKRWFLPQRSGAKTCSPRCRLALHRKRKRSHSRPLTVAGDGVSSLASNRRPGSSSK